MTVDYEKGPPVVITAIYGSCPVHGEGTVNGMPFSFGARGDIWVFRIEHPDGSAVWRHQEPYGVWPAAGYMSPREAKRFIGQAASRYLRGEPGVILREDYG